MRYRKHLRQMTLLLTVMVMTLSGVGVPVMAQGTTVAGTGTFEEINPATQRAIEKGLAYLARTQLPDGSWSYSGHGGRGGSGHVGITALAGLAFMAGGNLPGRGQYGTNVAKATDYLMKHVRRDGYINSSNSRMYSHGFATLFLAEVYGMTNRPDIKNGLKRAVRLIERCQNHEGGWRYDPAPSSADISITICQIMALRAARNAGIKVDKRVIDHGVLYVKSCQCKDGGFSYTARSGSSGFARTAAGVCSLYYAGAYGEKAVARGLAYLHKNSGKNMRVAGHFHYGHYYAVQAMFQAGGDYWVSYYTRIRNQLVKTQKPDGSWDGGPGGGRSGRGAYAAAMSCIILEVPYRYLPIWQR